MKELDAIAEQIQKLVGQIDNLLDTNSGHALSTQAGKLAIQLEYLLEHKHYAKQIKNKSYAEVYAKERITESQGDAKVYADAKKDATYDRIEAIESGVKSILSTVKDKLKWLELENQNKDF